MMARLESFKQSGPRDQATVILAAIEGGLDNIKDGIPTNIENLFNRIEEMKFLIPYLPTSWTHY